VLNIGTLSFANPFMLSAFILLPGLWWFLKLTPPTPIRMMFPPLRFLLPLKSTQEQSESAPWWLLLLRLGAAAALILAASQPRLQNTPLLTGKGPVYMIIDNGWSAGGGWQKRQNMSASILREAKMQQRPVVMIQTARSDLDIKFPDPQLLTAVKARKLFNTITPKPWGTERRLALRPLLQSRAFQNRRPGDVYWLSDGLEESIMPASDSIASGAGMAALLSQLRRFGRVRLVGTAKGDPIILRVPERVSNTTEITAVRTNSGSPLNKLLNIFADNGQLLDQKPLVFKTNAILATVQLDLPKPLLNRIRRITIDGASQAAAVLLFDQRWQRRRVGLLKLDNRSPAQSLLSPEYYINKALAPTADIIAGSLESLFKNKASTIFLMDPPQLKKPEQSALAVWIDKGGVLIRFAGPRLAARTSASRQGLGRSLLPVQLNQGSRTLGGALSWDQPQQLAAFQTTSLFNNLVPSKDVTVKAQVLATPFTSSTTASDGPQIWARLTDGTPLVSAQKRGLGWTILFHTTANAEWSNLALSGLFVSMLKRIVNLSDNAVVNAQNLPLNPLQTIDGFGQINSASKTVLAIPATEISTAIVVPGRPPGIYGNGDNKLALNLSTLLANPVPITEIPSGVQQSGYLTDFSFSLFNILLSTVVLLVLVDWLISLWFRGLLPRKILSSTAIVLVSLVFSNPAKAVNDNLAMTDTRDTVLAYVITGDDDVDTISRAGLSGLGDVLKQRTAIEPGAPRGIRPGVDEMAFYAFLYWPLTAFSVTLDDRAARNVTAYLNNGGTILFDTRSGPLPTPMGPLIELSKDLDLPTLMPMPSDYVLGRTFYLLTDFPGRWQGGTIWIEPPGRRGNDDVTAIIAGNADWARAWARGTNNQPLYPVIPGGERQREMAYRFGVNLIMMTLTGSYKADQIHLKEILKRLRP